ncbi:hypothetical protein RSSM_01841 [Rhodopirellula sallentina SM41]|uniref:Uncharacterized protein n=1 Tax=Rhodopirellula sallentina SM41 TaxID=1263870 RepID=M5UFW5_9BACT|nr:hypothetical protein RSSM_01841 [Rhodopirellula sallentina SM41]
MDGILANLAADANTSLIKMLSLFGRTGRPVKSRGGDRVSRQSRWVGRFGAGTGSTLPLFA